MAVRIEFDDWLDGGSYDVWNPLPRFRLLDDAGGSLGIIIVLLSRTAEAILAGQPGFENQFGGGTHAEPIVRAVLRYGVREIERGLRQGVLPPESLSTTSHASELLRLGQGDPTAGLFLSSDTGIVLGLSKEEG